MFIDPTFGRPPRINSSELTSARDVMSFLRGKDRPAPELPLALEATLSNRDDAAEERDRLTGLLWDELAQAVPLDHGGAQARLKRMRIREDKSGDDRARSFKAFMIALDHYYVLKACIPVFGRDADVVTSIREGQHRAPGTWKLRPAGAGPPVSNRPGAPVAGLEGYPLEALLGAPVVPGPRAALVASKRPGEAAGFRFAPFEEIEFGPGTTFGRALRESGARAAGHRRDARESNRAYETTRFVADVLEAVIEHAEATYFIPDWADLNGPARGAASSLGKGRPDPETEWSETLKKHLRAVLTVRADGETYPNQTRWAGAVAEFSGVTPQAVLDAFRGQGLIRTRETAADYERFRARIERTAEELLMKGKLGVPVPGAPTAED